MVAFNSICKEKKYDRVYYMVTFRSVYNWIRNGRDFAEKHGTNSDNITTYLKQVFSNGKVEYTRQTYKSGKMGYEKLYNYKGQYYLLTGVGTNGFIVTAYPIDKAIALKLKGRYEK